MTDYADLESEVQRLLEVIKENCRLPTEYEEIYADSVRHRITHFHEERPGVKRQTSIGLREIIKENIPPAEISDLIDKYQEALVSYVRKTGITDLFDFTKHVRQQRHFNEELYRLTDGLLFSINLGKFIRLKKKTPDLMDLMFELDTIAGVEYNLHIIDLETKRLENSDGDNDYHIKAGVAITDEYLSIAESLLHWQYNLELAVDLFREKIQERCVHAYRNCLMVYYTLSQHEGYKEKKPQKMKLLNAYHIFQGVSGMIESKERFILDDGVKEFYESLKVQRFWHDI